VISAGSIDEAVAAVMTHPYVGRGGTPQVSEAVSP